MHEQVRPSSLEARDNRHSSEIEHQHERDVVEAIDFSEAATNVRAKRLKEKILHDAHQRYGEIEPGDPRVTLLRRVYDRIVHAMPDIPRGQVSFLASPDINAFAVRAQSDVFVHDGLLRGYVHWCERNGEVPSEDALAVVVAHELGHIRQGTEEVDASEDGRDDEKHKKGKEEKKHEHQQRLNDEYDADRFGLLAIARAGYNPREGLKMLKFQQSLDDGISLPTTHPRSDDRLRELVALVESPDTIIQNTDTLPTALETALVKELGRDDVRRPGTALYRATKNDLGRFILSSETMPDVLEVVQVAEMHRYFTEINRLRQVESIRTEYARRAVADNIRQVIDAMECAYAVTDFQGASFVLSSDDLPTNTTRFIMREYGYMQDIAEQDSKSAEFDAHIVAGFADNVAGDKKYLNERIQRRIDDISQKINTLPEGGELYRRSAEYKQKLEFIRDNLTRTLEGVDHAALAEFVANVDVQNGQDWINEPETHSWLMHVPTDELLDWCKTNGTLFFSQLIHPYDEKLRHAISGVGAVDSRYQSYLPGQLLEQEDFSTPKGRAAFIEQSIFVHTEKCFKWKAGSSLEFSGYLERTKNIPEKLKPQLCAMLETRYAFLRNSQRLAEAMANAILSDDYSGQYDVQKILRDISPDEAHSWVATVQPMRVSYRPSANALFLAETGIHGKMLDKQRVDVYRKFYRAEEQWTEIIRKKLDIKTDSTYTDELMGALALGDEHVRSDALDKIAEILHQQVWTEAGAEELDRRLSPVLRELKPTERRVFLSRVLGSGRKVEPNFFAVVDYAIDACPDYAQVLLSNQWEHFATQASDEERLRLLKRMYARASDFSDLRPNSWSQNRFVNNAGREYIKSSIALHGEEAFITAITELAADGLAYGKPGEPLFADKDIQHKLENLSDQQILLIAQACKDADAVGKARDVWDNSFTIFTTRRVLELYGVQGFNPKDIWSCTFDTRRAFEEVFAGIGEYVTPHYAEIMLQQCVSAYGRAPEDVVIAGLEHYYKAIPASVIRTGKTLGVVDLSRRSVDDYAKAYDPQAKPFHEERRYSPSCKREAIESFVHHSGFLRDRSKTAVERMNIVTELIPERTDYRDVLFGEIEQDFLAEYSIKSDGHRLVVDGGTDGKLAAALAYTFYTAALPEMIDQARMQLWGRRADALYREYLRGESESLHGELTRIQRLFPRASFARDEALYDLGNTTLVKTPEHARQVQDLLSEMQRQTSDTDDLLSQSQLERFNVLMGNLSRAEKKDFLLWTIGATDTPPKSLRAYGGLNNVSVKDVPAFVFAATRQEREQLLLRLFVGGNGLFEPQNPEDEKVLDEFVDHAFDRIFPNDETEGVTGEPRDMLRTVFSTVLTEYDAYRRGKIFIGMLESIQEREGSGRGEKIAALMNELGPVFVKVGQVLSETEKAPGEYLLPEDIRTSMKRLKQSAKRFHRMAAVFSLEAANEFNTDNPNQIAYVGDTLAAASIKQVNAVVRVDGREAVEKVLRPSIEKHLQEDVRVLGKIVERMRAIVAVPRGIESVGATYVQEEADFAREVANTKKINRVLRNYKKSAVIRKMPVRTTEVYSYSKTHIQEEKIRGLSLEELTRLSENPSTIGDLAGKYDLTDAEQQAYLSFAGRVTDIRLQAFDALAYQYFQADAFHSDPHAGNLFVTPEGELVFIDNGSIGETQKADRDNLKKFFLGFALRQQEQLRAAIGGLARGLESRHIDTVLEVVQSQVGDAEKMNRILVIITEGAKEIDPAFDKFLKSFATGAYLMSDLRADDVRMVLGAYTQGDSGSLRSYAATAVARAAQENPDTLIGRAARKLIDR